jgi:anti-sigma B factor antagonist
MTTAARVNAVHHGDVSVARVEGEVDAANVDGVAAKLHDLLTNRSMALVVDLTATTYLDSAGINLLFALGDELRARQQTLRIVIVDSSPIARMASITGLDRACPTHASVDDALAAS